MIFPLYGVRSYVDVYDEGMYRIIETYRGKWTLDHKYETDNNYWQRRLQLLQDRMKPYPLYPLKKKFNNLSQMLKYKTDRYIDSNGKLHKYKKSKFYKLKCVKIDATWKTSKGYSAIKSREVPTTFIIEEPLQPYFRYIKMGRKFILYDLCSEEIPTRRIKI